MRIVACQRFRSGRVELLRNIELRSVSGWVRFAVAFSRVSKQGADGLAGGEGERQNLIGVCGCYEQEGGARESPGAPGELSR